MWNWFNNNLDIWKVQTVHKGTDLRKLCEMNYLHGCTLRQWEEAESKWQVNRRKLLAYQQLHFVCKREQIFQFSLASELNVFRCIIGLLIFFSFFLIHFILYIYFLWILWSDSNKDEMRNWKIFYVFRSCAHVFLELAGDAGPNG